MIMDTQHVDLGEFHWLMDVLQSIDVGLVVLDRELRVCVWNGFMENYSGRRPSTVIGKSVFELSPAVPEDWFRRKLETVFLLKNRAFTTWEQRPFLFRFKNTRPITGSADFMYQNVTFLPLTSLDGETKHIGIVIYDVTDIAVNKIELQKANAQLQSLSRTDRLTQLYNRGYWEECLVREYDRIRRTRQPSSLIMFDIDHFKKVNDTYGHQVGDEVIRNTAQMLRQSIRSTDIAGRYGGEEFGIILVDTEADGALVVAERLRKNIEAYVVTADSHSVRYTISLGVSAFYPELKDHKHWIASADQALYDSKHGGRNRSTVFDVPTRTAGAA